MSELDVIVIHIRAEQAAEYERLFTERELPRWREYKERGAFLMGAPVSQPARTARRTSQSPNRMPGTCGPGRMRWFQHTVPGPDRQVDSYRKSPAKGWRTSTRSRRPAAMASSRDFHGFDSRPSHGTGRLR
jgi:hypothetical protein